MNQEILKCDRCGDPIRLVIAGRHGLFCAKCRRELYPPILILVEFDGPKGNVLYNLECGTTEEVELKTFDLCGWFLRCTQEVTHKSEALQTEKFLVHYLEYYGTQRCVRTPQHKRYYNGVDCTNSICRKCIPGSIPYPLDNQDIPNSIYYLIKEKLTGL